jgi:hypothetical protein
MIPSNLLNHHSIKSVNDVSTVYKGDHHSQPSVTNQPNTTMEETFNASYIVDIGFNRCILVECKCDKSYIDFATVSVQDGVPCKIRNKSLRLQIHGWKNFTEQLDEIEECFSRLCHGEEVNLKLPLGGQIYLSMTGGVLCVDIRTHYFDSDGVIQPGKPGIGLKLAEFQELLNIVDDINERLTDGSQPPSGRETPDIELLVKSDHINNSNNNNTNSNNSGNPRTSVPKLVRQ